MDRQRRKEKPFQVESSVYKGTEAGLKRLLQENSK